MLFFQPLILIQKREEFKYTCKNWGDKRQAKEKLTALPDLALEEELPAAESATEKELSTPNSTTEEEQFSVKEPTIEQQTDKKKPYKKTLKKLDAQHFFLYQVRNGA